MNHFVTLSTRCDLHAPPVVVVVFTYLAALAVRVLQHATWPVIDTECIAKQPPLQYAR